MSLYGNRKFDRNRVVDSYADSLLIIILSTLLLKSNRAMLLLFSQFKCKKNPGKTEIMAQPVKSNPDF